MTADEDDGLVVVQFGASSNEEFEGAVAELGACPGDAGQPSAAVVLDVARFEDADDGGHIGVEP